MNQPITGYRLLNEAELSLINEIKEHGEQTRELVNRVHQFCIERDQQPLAPDHAPHSLVTQPLRWAAIGQSDLQTGYMALVRAVAAPSTF